jgi:hypothetical protein
MPGTLRHALYTDGAGGDWFSENVMLDPWKIGPGGCPETSVRNYYPSPRNIKKAQTLFKPRRLPEITQI